MTRPLSLAIGVAALAAVAALAQQTTPPLTPDIPSRFDEPTGGYDYVKRDVMIPMRDGAKLHTVIVVPKGARNAPLLLTRTPYNASARAQRNRSTSCSRPTDTSASTRTCAGSTDPKVST